MRSKKLRKWSEYILNNITFCFPFSFCSSTVTVTDPYRHLCQPYSKNEVIKIRDNAHLLLIGGIGSAGAGIEERVRKKLDSYGITDIVILAFIR